MKVIWAIRYAQYAIVINKARDFWKTADFSNVCAKLTLAQHFPVHGVSQDSSVPDSLVHRMKIKALVTEHY